MTSPRQPAPDARRLSAAPTAEIVHAALMKQRAEGYRQAAAELMARAEDLEQEARQAGEVWTMQAEADRDLERPRRKRVTA